ncbi:MAG TPA: carnitine 3-dehydrogenase [Gaiellaceae bacterium]|nr:carnitine 3-dehydrogenase [Gaiellaceae bacterium]
MGERPASVGLLGGGVIGAGWAARFLLNGVDVRLYDPDPEAGRKVGEVLELARRAYGLLTLAPLPQEGALTFAASPEEAAEGADFVQESAPERPELKQELLAAAERASDPNVVFCSSTSGLRPTELQARMERPERLAVGHPFNPVYLLPLVEVCGGERTAPETVERAAAVYRSVGMHPLVIRREIDGFVADRLLEALWREALWLVHDDVATVAEVDDAIRYGAGLRWAFMGTFLTYRIAGGEAGMRHFIAQFGPALQWPWTKLVDVPELTAELVDKIAAQSDEQAAGSPVRELEQWRDDCIVALLQGLRGEDTGAGATLASWERSLLDGGRGVQAPGGGPVLHESRIPAAWVDYNGHVHESRYLQLFGDATDALLGRLGVDAEYLTSDGSYFTVETHLSHLGELHAGDAVHVATQVLGADEKRLHLFHTLRRHGADAPLATAEQMLLHVDAVTGRAGPARDAVRDRVASLADAHSALPRPDRAGRRIALG